MAIVGPIAPESNPPINPQYYEPRRWVISALTRGQTTMVTTTADLDFVVGQEVRLIIPPQNGSRQLNEQKGFVLSLPTSNQCVVGINSAQNVDPFISSFATITGATQANPCVLTANNGFAVLDRVAISDVEGMTQLNGNVYTITAATPTSITINVNSTAFTAYSAGGVATLATTLPQILPIGDVNTGQINSTGRSNVGTFIPGSFINISPN